MSKKKKSKRNRDKEEHRLERQLKQNRNLHTAAKWKRILSACDFWFSKANLATDDFVRDTLKSHNGWMPIPTLLTFPKFHFWTDAQLLVDAFQSTAAGRYIVTFDEQLTHISRSKAGTSSGQVILVARDDWNELETNIERGSKLKSATSGRNGSYDTTTHVAAVEPDERTQSDRSGQNEDAGLNSADNEYDDTDDDYWTDLDYSSDEDNCDTDDAEISLESSTIVSPQALSNNPENAFVRHRKVGMDLIESLEMKQEEELRQLLQNDSVLSGFEPFPWEDDAHSLDETDVPAVKAKKVQLTEYKCKREVRVIRGVQGLQKLCDDVVESARTLAERLKETNACAVGFDVEYCTLELDIRSTLPAMIQLASPSQEGPIGLIWLDKFTNHGRDILSDKAYSPLATLLADSTILKVGVGASKDAFHLAQWWSISEQKDMVHFFAGMTDLESEFDDKVNGKSLQQMCGNVLCRRLPKLKEKKRNGKDRTRTPTSHWRTDTMTDMMRHYAANDAASAIDIWMTLHGFQGASKKTKKSKKKTKSSTELDGS